MRMPQTGECNDCGAWAEALDRHRRCAACHNKRDDALENLAETAAMYCASLPTEVAAALHAIPHYEKQHDHARGVW